jgi:NADH-quinone oxidoreductase subunit M
MLSHGIVSGALFLCVGVVYDRLHTREIAAYGGLVERMPVYAVCFMVFALANMGLPGTSGFVGEFLTLLGTFRVNTWVVIFGSTGLILSAAYMLYLYGRVIFGALVKPALKVMQDLSVREIAILTPLVAFTIILGVYPRIVFDETSVSVANLVAQHRLAMVRDAAPDTRVVLDLRRACFDRLSMRKDYAAIDMAPAPRAGLCSPHPEPVEGRTMPTPVSFKTAVRAP